MFVCWRRDLGCVWALPVPSELLGDRDALVS